MRRHRAAGRRVDGSAELIRKPRELTVVDRSDVDQHERITVEEVRAAQARRDEVIILDARADKSFRADTRTAEGALRVEPDDPVRDATELQLSKTATLVVYCA
jgi:3-mercaptopyruvate sulfurtransferase SseA